MCCPCVAARAGCTYEEKMQCIATVNTLMELTRIGFTNGILSMYLQEEAKKYKNYFITAGLHFIGEGVEPSVISDILNTKLNLSSAKGKEYLESLMIIRWVLLLQNLTRVEIIKASLMSFIE